MSLPPHRRGSAARLGVRALATTLLLGLFAGCSGAPTDPFAASGRPSTCVTPATTRLAELPSVLVPGLTLATQADETLQAHVSSPVLPGLASLNAAVAAEIDTQWTRYQAAATRDGELNIGWNLTGVSDRSIGIEVQTRRRDASGEQTRITVHWYDRAGAQLLASTELLTPEGWQQLTDRFRRDLCGVGQLGSDRAVGFAADGSLVVAASAAGNEPTLYAVPAAEAASWLSPAGHDAQASTVHPQALPAPATRSTQPLGPQPTTKPSVEPKPKPPAKKPSPRAKTEVDCARQRCVALTFDDGPGPYTAGLVRSLKAAKAPATFFMIGEHVDALPSLARQVSNAGFEIGSHSYNHPDLTRLTDDELATQLERTSAALLKATGHRPNLLRPPYGARSARVDHAAARAGMGEVLWDVDTLDWKHRNPKAVRKAVRQQVRRGSIVLLHDIHPTTVQAVPDIVAELRKSGYTLVTVSELIGRPKNGSVHFRAG